jgi:uncharacterized membrane protein
VAVIFVLIALNMVTNDSKSEHFSNYYPYRTIAGGPLLIFLLATFSLSTFSFIDVKNKPF